MMKLLTIIIAFALLSGCTEIALQFRLGADGLEIMPKITIDNSFIDIDGETVGTVD
jgi:hypothetical protein